MYGRDIKAVMRGIITECDDTIRSKDGKVLKASQRNALIDRILLELWFRGYAVSARSMDVTPAGARRNQEAHDRWRENRRLGIRTPPAA